MDFEFGDALQSLRPGAEWVSVSGDYENIQWLSEDMEKPTKTEIEMEIWRLRGEKPWKELRAERDIILSQTDKYATIDFPTRVRVGETGVARLSSGAPGPPC
jgi:hypothetical protein